MRPRMSRGWAMGSLLALGMLALATVEGPAPVAWAADPCCAITAIDAKTGVVTAVETDTGRSFEFKVADAALLKTLKVGQKISADLKAGTVTLPSAKPGLKPVRVRITKAEPPGAAAAAPRRQRTGAGGIGRSAPPVKVTAGDLRGDENQAKACREVGGEWRCTVVSTGSSPGPEDDVVSCHCIRNQ